MTELAPLVQLAKAVLEAAEAQRLKIATAESCTGGLIVAALTEVPGSSAVVDRGFVTYSNEAKTEMIGVDPELIERHGAVSAEVAVAMAEGAVANSAADVAVAVTGIAGPGGGSAEKPVGLVHFAAARRDGPTRHAVRVFEDSGRSSIRLAATRQALTMLMDAVAESDG